MRNKVVVVAVLLVLALLHLWRRRPVDYVRDVKPILASVVIAATGRSGRRRAFGSTRRL